MLVVPCPYKFKEATIETVVPISKISPPDVYTGVNNDIFLKVTASPANPEK